MMLLLPGFICLGESRFVKPDYCYRAEATFVAFRKIKAYKEALTFNLQVQFSCYVCRILTMNIISTVSLKNDRLHLPDLVYLVYEVECK